MKGVENKVSGATFPLNQTQNTDKRLYLFLKREGLAYIGGQFWPTSFPNMQIMHFVEPLLVQLN